MLSIFFKSIYILTIQKVRQKTVRQEQYNENLAECQTIQKVRQNFRILQSWLPFYKTEIQNKQ